jgi:hypothetical protein
MVTKTVKAEKTIALMFIKRTSAEISIKNDNVTSLFS